MARSINNVVRISGIVIVLLLLLLNGCSNSNRQENTQRLIDVLAEVEKLKVEVELKQIEKKQLENQLALKEEKIKEYTEKREFVEKRCP